MLKILKPSAATPDRLRHEYGILHALDAPGLVAARALEEDGTKFALVLEDHGGETLAAHLARGPLSQLDALRIAAQVAETLGHIHRQRVIHKDINPTNLLLDEAGRARVFDFDIATRLPREIQSIRTPNLLAGTLPYISPEQTGRMNRAIDYRTDLYSLGSTIYLMLTGRVPFTTTDSAELIFCHLARKPTPPAALDPGIPEAVSDIVMKLLEKTAEARYQSAFGLKIDLDRCQAELEQRGRVERFQLAQEDVSDRFQIPQKLYGREEEIAALEGAFARAREGTPELVLVSGSSGIGKSSTIQELYKPLAQRRGYFVSGKFDLLRRGIPYSALVQALSELIRILLSEPEGRLAVFRRRILDVVQDAGSVLTDVLPDLVRIIGPQQPAPKLPGAESGNRFRVLFENLIQVFTRHGECLVIFLDDLQWSDAATTDLLPALLANTGSEALLLIGAYRDNEVTAEHHLLRTIDAMEKSGRRIPRIAVNPISRAHVSRLIEDTLIIGEEEARPVAELLWRRTGGNPLFVGEFLTMLHKSGVIEFDAQKRRWSLDLARIERAPSTDNVGQLMAARAAALSPGAQEMLRLAAVLGNRFELAPLAIVAQRSREEAARILDEALQEGLVLSINQGPRAGYRFLHDRVQQTVYASIPEFTKVEVHLRTGQLLLRGRPQEDHDDWLFEVLRHLNLAADAVDRPAERLELARLNLAAGMRARASGAFAAAAIHYAAGIRFLPENTWDTRPTLMFELHFGLAECEYLNGHDDAAEKLFAVLVQRASVDIDQVVVYELMAWHKLQRGRFDEALKPALKALEILGIKLDPAPETALVTAEFKAAKRAIGGRSPRELLELPEAADHWAQIQLRLLMMVATLGTQISSNLHAIVASRMVRLSLEHGNSSQSGSAYAAYALTVILVSESYAEADAFARLALDLCARYPDKSAETQTKATYLFICPWRHPMRESLALAHQVREAGLMSGMLTYVNLALVGEPMTSLLAGFPLDAVRGSVEKNLELARKLKSNHAERALPVLHHAVLALQSFTRSLGSFETNDFNERDYASWLSETPTINRVDQYHYAILKIMVLHVLGFLDEALAISSALRSGLNPLLNAEFSIAEFYFHDALLLISRAGERAGEDVAGRRRALQVIRGHLRKLETWAENAPTNFRHTYLLVLAEHARVTRNDHVAIGCYEEAIKLARSSRFLQHEALALELASQFYRLRGAPDFATEHLARAREVYLQWGAQAKVALLDRAYPGLVARAGFEPQRPLQVTTTASDTASRILDIPSMIRATQALSSEVSFDKLLLRLMGIVAENAGAERGALVLDQEGALVVVAEFTAQEGASLPSSRTLLAGASNLPLALVTYVVRKGESVILSDATTEGPFVNDPYVASRKVRAVLCTPLLQKGVVAGTLYLENNLVSGAFTSERAELASMLCAQMAISIDNAHLYADLESKVVERTRALREAQARLIKLEKESTEIQMAGGFAHEMRNALTSAQIMLRTVLRDSETDKAAWSVCVDNSEKLGELFLQVRHDLPETSLEKVKGIFRAMSEGEQRLDKVLRGVGRCVDRGLRITRLILEYAQLGKATPGDQSVSLGALVQMVLEDLKNELRDKHIAVDVETSKECVLIGDEMHFHAIVQNLILNARDALLGIKEESERRLTLRVTQEPEQHVVLVRDTGPGIPAELHEKIFEPFFSTKPNTGTGLGLGMVRKLAALYGGVIELDSATGRGTTFRVIFPRQAAAASAPWSFRA